MEQSFFLSYNFPKENTTQKYSNEPVAKLSEHIKHNNKKEGEKQLTEKLELVVDEIVKLFYEIEQSILAKGSISEEMYTRLEGLKELNSVYKKALNFQEPEKVSLPLIFIEEYSSLQRRAENIIEKTIGQMEKLSNIEGSGLFIEESKKRIEVLTLLSSHYKRVLDLV